jgi:hypothetical protein
VLRKWQQGHNAYFRHLEHASQLPAAYAQLLTEVRVLCGCVDASIVCLLLVNFIQTYLLPFSFVLSCFFTSIIPFLAPIYIIRSHTAPFSSHPQLSRRRAFALSFDRHLAACRAHTGRLRAAETAAREVFIRIHGSHLPPVFFAMVPSLQVSQSV